MADHEEYNEYRSGRRAGWVLRDDADTIGTALFSGVGCRPVTLGGRGALYEFSWAQGTGLIRFFRRGGVMRHITQDAHFCCNRPRREFEVHKYVYENGLRVPRLLGVFWERRGPWVRGGLATGRLEAVGLPEALKRDAGGAQRMLAACGALIREMHGLGVWHADLQIHNMLVGGDGPYLIDFDKAKHGGMLSERAKARNLLRLRRSFEKAGMPEAYFSWLLSGYGEVRISRVLSFGYRVKGQLSTWILGN